MVMAAQLKVVGLGGDGVSTDRQKALEAALAQIDRAFGKGSAMKLGSREKIEIETVSTGSLGLDIALGVGGLPRGRVIEVYGPESSGKTTLALHVIAEAQKTGGTAAFIDAEHALDPVSLRSAWLISRACRPTWLSPISPSISALGTSAATESITSTSIAFDRTSVSTISSACSPVSGCDTISSSMSTPSFLA